MKKIVLGFIPVFIAATLMAGCSMLTWDSKQGSKKEPSVSDENMPEVAPEGIDKNQTNPISPPEESRTSVSRAKIVSVQKFGEDEQGQRQYFEVIDETKKQIGKAKADPLAQPVRIIIYDNNAIQKDYPMEFGVAWGRTLEAMLDMPLSTIDKSSGVITTAWVYDKAKLDSGSATMSFLTSVSAPVRYKYTVRLLSRGGMTQIKVVSHAEVREAQQWATVRPKLVVTEKLFDRIELELRTPIFSDRF